MWCLNVAILEKDVEGEDLQMGFQSLTMRLKYEA